jgi:hypothetical protein
MGALGLERDLPRVALIGAQAAARDLLLALGGSRLRPSSRDLRLLQEIAAMDRLRVAGIEPHWPVAGDALAVVQRLLRQLPAEGPPDAPPPTGGRAELLGEGPAAAGAPRR